jgi:hypothetical protein
VKLDLLFESAAQVRPFANEMYAKFRAIAKKYDLVFDIPLGWPQISSKQVGFGGTLKLIRGKADAEQLPLNILVKGCLKEISNELGRLMDEGHTIQVLPGLRSQDHNVGGYNAPKGTPRPNLRVSVTNKDEIFRKLMDGVEFKHAGHSMAAGPTVGWTVSVPTDYIKEKAKLYVLSATIYTRNDRAKAYKFTAHAFVPLTDKSTLEEIGKFGNIGYHATTDKQSPELVQKLFTFTKQLYGGSPKVDKLTLADINWFGVSYTGSKKQYRRDSNELSLAEFKKLAKFIHDNAVQVP